MASCGSIAYVSPDVLKGNLVKQLKRRFFINPLCGWHHRLFSQTWVEVWCINFINNRRGLHGGGVYKELPMFFFKCCLFVCVAFRFPLVVVEMSIPILFFPSVLWLWTVSWLHIIEGKYYLPAYFPMFSLVLMVSLIVLWHLYTIVQCVHCPLHFPICFQLPSLTSRWWMANKNPCKTTWQLSWKKRESSSTPTFQVLYVLC